MSQFAAISRPRYPPWWVVVVAAATFAPGASARQYIAVTLLAAVALAARAFPVPACAAVLALTVAQIADVFGPGANPPIAALIPPAMAMRYCSRQGVMAAGALTLANCCLGTWAVLADRLQGTIFNGWWIRFGVYLLELSPASGATGAASKLVLLGLFWLPSLAVMALALAWRWRASLTAKNAAAGQAFAQRERQLIAAAAEEAERGRISREMHDIVAHSLSVIIAQADGGRYAAANNPEAAVTALAAISETGRAALADMRGIVRGLREGPPEADPARLEPVPHARDIDELIETVRAAGLDASMVRMGTPRDLPPGMGLTIHRIVQEALTNAMKHAGPGARVTVLERWDPTAITLTVTDDGRGAAASGDGQGHGVLGMRERTEMLGGVFMAGPSPTGGFQVRATIPLPSAPVTQ